VQESVAQCFRFYVGEFAVQGEQLQPREQVAGDGRGGAPGLVDGEVTGGQAAQAGVLAAADAVLDPGLGAVAGFKKRDLPGGSVGGQQLVAPAVMFLEQ
jgi:hypothetical protein